MKEKLCTKHGPYDASLPACPYCSGGGRPPAPPSLDEDDMPTDLGVGGSFGETPTDISPRRSKGGVVSLDDDEKTELGRSHLDDDVTEVEFVDTGVQAILWAKEGDRRGRIYKIKDGAVLGRKDGDLVLDDAKVSNPHAKFVVENDDFVIWDFGSKNGTFVNGERIRAATIIKENDTVKIGDSLFVLKILQ
jgi:hypothetical protein